MKFDDFYDRLVDMLLWESVGRETPPDIRDRVMKALEEEAVAVAQQPVHGAPPAGSPRSVLVRRLAWAACVALLLGLGVFIYLKQISAARTPMLTASSGSMNRSAGPIAPGESITTDSESGAVITYRDGTVVELAPESTVTVREGSPWDRSKDLEIVAGGVQAEVAPQPAGSPMVLFSKDARAEVVGTKLAFLIGGGRSHLQVLEGSVRFIPFTADHAVLVQAGGFAEAGKSGFQTGSVRGITGFTLMNAVTDHPIRDAVLADGETISLASLPTREINLRAEFDGWSPATVTLRMTRDDGNDTGIPPQASKPQKHAPFFVAGDHWADGRPTDCRAWTPRPGHYRLSAEARYLAEDTPASTRRLTISFRITP